MKQTYDHRFFKNHHEMTVHAARTILPLVLEALPPVRSVIDIGCGVGTWLSVLAELGIEEVLGIDGAWVERELLEIDEDRFRAEDLQGPIEVDGSFDLAMALEVAEHLPPERARGFVETLVQASDFVLFSAAVPYQGGEGHLNEQWQDEWAGLFAERGFAPIDLVRSQIWDDRRIPVWYRQNLLLFVRETELGRVKVAPETAQLPLRVVHPELYLLRVEGFLTLRGGWKSFRRGLRGALLRSLGRGR